MRVGLQPAHARSPARSAARRRRRARLARGLAEVGRSTTSPSRPRGAGGRARGCRDGRAGVPQRSQHPERLVAMSLAAVRPAAARDYTGLDAVHYPLTVALPTLELPSAVTVHDLQHLDHPRALLPGGALWRARNARALGAQRGRGDRAEPVRAPRAIELLGLPPERVHAIPLGVDHARFRPGDEEREPFLLYPPAVAAQEPRPPLRGVRAAARRAARAAARPHRRRPRGPRRAARRRRGARPRPGRRARVALPPRGVPRLPEPVRGLRPAAARGDGLGRPVAAADSPAIPEVCGDAAALFDPSDAEDIAAGILETDDCREEHSWTRGSSGGAVHVGRDRAPARGGLRRGLLQRSEVRTTKPRAHVGASTIRATYAATPTIAAATEPRTSPAGTNATAGRSRDRHSSHGDTARTGCERVEHAEQRDQHDECRERERDRQAVELQELRRGPIENHLSRQCHCADPGKIRKRPATKVSGNATWTPTDAIIHGVEHHDEPSNLVTDVPSIGISEDALHDTPPASANPLQQPPNHGQRDPRCRDDMRLHSGGEPHASQRNGGDEADGERGHRDESRRREIRVAEARDRSPTGRPANGEVHDDIEQLKRAIGSAAAGEVRPAATL